MFARIVKAFVILFFALMTTLLFLRQPSFTAQSAEDLASLAGIASGEGPIWSGVYFVDAKTGKRTKIGYSKSETIRTKAGYVVRGETQLKITAQGHKTQVRVLSKVLTDLDSRLVSLDFSMLSDSIKFEMFGRVEGDKLKLDIRTAAGNQTMIVDLPENTVLPETLLAQAARRGLEVGETIQAPFFDPTTFSFIDSELRVVEKITLPEAGDAVVYHLQAQYGGITIDAWVDSQGNTLREEAAVMLTKVETEKQALTAGWGGSAPVDLIDQVAVKVARTIKNPRSRTRLRLRLRGVELDKFDLRDQRQSFEDGVVDIRVETLPASGPDRPIRDPNYAKWLEATPTIQVRDPAIAAKARQIVGEEKNALKAARLLSDWVYQSLEKKPLISIPSARDVLDIKRGDCNEHATLFTALARAAGIPTRIEVGLVYNDKRFYYHAWNAVYVGEWVALDATFGQFPADATHLKVLSGDLGAQILILSMIGKLEIEVLESP